eukprot:scaffold47073_cov59-Attheya_sp.AAC.4
MGKNCHIVAIFYYAILLRSHLGNILIVLDYLHSSASDRRYVNGAPPNGALLPHQPKYLEPVSSQPNSVCRLDHDASKDTTWENRGPGPRGDGTRAAAGSRKRPTDPHNNKKVVVLGSMLGPSALFNTGYRHRANGGEKEPWIRRKSRLAYRRANQNATIAYTGVEMYRMKRRN